MKPCFSLATWSPDGLIGIGNQLFHAYRTFQFLSRPKALLIFTMVGAVRSVEQNSCIMQSPKRVSDANTHKYQILYIQLHLYNFSPEIIRKFTESILFYSTWVVVCSSTFLIVAANRCSFSKTITTRLKRQMSLSHTKS